MQVRKTTWLRILCLTFALLLSLVTLAACSGGGEGGVSTDPGTNSNIGGSESGTAAPVIDDVPAEPDISYKQNGTPAQFNLAVRANRYHYLFCDDENTKDTVEYATWQRNTAIEDKYGIIINKVELQDSTATWTTRLNSGSTGDIDLACWDYWWGLEQLGLFVDLCTLDELNLDQDWYYSGWNENVTINGICYSVVGDAALESLENIEVMFFNKSMAAAHELDLYSLVDNGEWTLAKVAEIAKEVAQNLDDETNAIYGVTYDVHAVRAGLYSSGIKMITINPENGAISITANSQINVDIADAFRALVHGEGAKFSNTLARVTDCRIFTGGTTMMLAGALYRGYSIRDLRSENFSYGVVVTPKYDTDATYKSTFYGVSVFSIPTFCTDRSMSAVIMDAMNRRSNDTIVSAFYDRVLMNKIADAPDDARMLDLARDSIVVDFAFVAEGSIILLSKFQTAVIGNTSISTSIAEVAQTAKGQLEDMLGIYQ